VRNVLHFVVLLLALPVVAQTNTGELRLKVTDPLGLGVKSAVKLSSEANEFHDTFTTDDSGVLIAKRLPFGLYRVEIEQPDFAPASVTIELRSAIPMEYHISLALPSINTSVTVQAEQTLIDPHRANSEFEIGSETIQTRTTSLPGRSLQDLVG